MIWPGSLSTEKFLADYWQKRPHFMTGAIRADLPILGGEELAWLATLEDVESRLVFTETSSGDTRYRVEQGPFEDATLAALPPKDWTLLVQDVEKHLPELRSWISAFAIVPEWRVDDLMISFAAPGGSVGPHVDNYDVFLCQIEGTRNWKIAQRDQDLRPMTSGGLSLVEPFDDRSPVAAPRGSVLYLPPGVAHWGIAEDACLTYSVGMRAPSAAELRCTFDREFPDESNPFIEDDERFYADDDLQLEECGGNRISVRATGRCRTLLNDAACAGNRQLAITLGCTVTDVKAWLAPDIPDDKERQSALEIQSAELAVHGMARLAYWLDDAELLLFANGYWLQLDLSLEGQVQSLCTQRKIDAGRIKHAASHSLVDWLFDHGVIDWSFSPA